MSDIVKMGFSNLLSLETLFVLWLFSYQYKNIPLLKDMPDITVLLTGIFLPLGGFLYFKEKKQRPASSFSFKKCQPLFLFLALSLWLICSSFWSESHHYRLEKLLCFVIYTIPGFLIAYLVMGACEERIKRLIWIFISFGGIVGAESLRIFWSKGIYFIHDILSANYLVTGQTLGVSLCSMGALSLYRFSQHRQYTNYQLWAFAFVFWCLTYILLNLGGRGPVIASILSVLCLYISVFVASTPRKHQILTHGCLILGTTLLFVLILNAFFGQPSTHFMQRMAPVVSLGQTDQSLAERFAYYQSAFKAFLRHPIIGLGLGGWPLFQGVGDISLHPHNIFLEVLCETGAIGFCLLCLFIDRVVKRAVNSPVLQNPYHMSLVSIGMFSFLNAMKTGDIHDNMLLFISLGLIARINPSLTKKKC